MDETPDLETLKDHIIPGLTLSHPDLMMKMLKHAGVTVNKAATPLLIVLIKNNMFNQAFEVGKHYFLLQLCTFMKKKLWLGVSAMNFISLQIVALLILKFYVYIIL